MIESPPFWLYIVGFLLLLGPLVTVHEFGHYLVGRFFGVGVEAFSVGFGKEVAGFTDRRGTRWKLSLLPLGGYCQFKGDMNPASIPDADAIAQALHDIPDSRTVRIAASGVSTARNIGAHLTSGEYLVFLDDDDRWHPDRLAAQVSLLRGCTCIY